MEQQLQSQNIDNKKGWSDFGFSLALWFFICFLCFSKYFSVFLL